MAIIRETQEETGQASLSAVAIFVTMILPPLLQVSLAAYFYIGYRFCLREVTKEGISHHRATLITMCFEGFISATSCTILYALGVLSFKTSTTLSDYRSDLFFLLTAGSIFAFAVISSASSMDTPSKKKALALLYLIPAVHFIMEGVFRGSIETGAIHCVGLGMMVVGGLLMN